jgi:hypothetical protein
MMMKTCEFRLFRRRFISAIVFVGFLLGGAGELSAQDAKRDAPTDAAVRPLFTETDAVRLMDGMRQALESNNRSQFLKLFDAKRMPSYAVFRDQVADFFGRYDAFVVHYHVTQVAMDGEFGAALANFELDARPSDGVTPNVRTSAALRLVTAWDGKQWRIVDISPRNRLR